eukprot:6389930-Amphidinium_carterae.3
MRRDRSQTEDLPLSLPNPEVSEKSHKKLFASFLRPLDWGGVGVDPRFPKRAGGAGRVESTQVARPLAPLSGKELLSEVTRAKLHSSHAQVVKGLHQEDKKASL